MADIGPHDQALEIEREGLELEDAIHRSMLDEQQLYAAMRARFEARLADAQLGDTYQRIIRNRIAGRRVRLAEQRAGKA